MSRKYEKTVGGVWWEGALCLSLALVCASCSEAGLGAQMEDSAACMPDDESCWPTTNVNEPEDVVFSVRIVPPAESGLAEQHLLDLQSDTVPTPLGVVLEATTLVTGRVSFSGDTPVEASGAAITFRRDGGIAEVPFVRTVTSGSSGASVGAFSVELVPGTYQVTVRSDESAVPPFRVNDLEVSTGTLINNIALPDPDTHYIVTGMLVRSEGDELEVPILGARVILVSPETGLAMSTEGETVEGAFSVRVPPNEDDYAVRISPGNGSEPVPDLTLETVHVAGSMDLGTLIAGEWDDSVEVTGHVSGINGEEQPVDGAAAFFVQELEHGSFTHVTFADSDGAFTTSLIPGSYEVTLVPPADVEYGAATFAETVSEANLEQEFPLGHKPSLLGTIMGPGGTPLNGATVIAEPVGYNISALSLGPVSTVTGSNGLYLLPVHRGDQRVTFLPPEGRALSPIVLESVSVSADKRLDPQLPAVRTVTGYVVDPAGDAVADALIEVYVDVHGERLLLWETETNAAGQFDISMPVIRDGL